MSDIVKAPAGPATQPASRMALTVIGLLGISTKEQHDELVLDKHPLAAAFFAACTGILLWLVLKHPDTGPQPGAAGVPLDEHVGHAAWPPATSAAGSGKQLSDTRQPAA